MFQRLVLACLILCAILMAACRDGDGRPPTDAVLPPATITATVEPPPSVAPALDIQIPAGATGILLAEQQVAAGGSVNFRLSAGAGQRLSVGVNPFAASSLPDFALEVTGSGGEGALQPRVDGVVTWSGELPTSQTYRLTVSNAGPATSFALQVQLPQRINFVPGPIAATLEGVVVPPVPNVYLVRVRAGQVLTATVSSPANLAWLGVAGEDGLPLLRLPMGQAAFAGVLPLGGDYTVNVAVLQEAAPPTVPFTLTLELGD